MSEENSEFTVPSPYWGPFPGETPELYERLAVPTIYKAIKPHFPEFFIGDFDMKQGRPTGTDPNSESHTEPTREEKLQRYVDWTKKNEKIHLGGLAVFGAFSAYFFQRDDAIGAALGTTYGAANVMLNLYPIALQRYNRLKAYRVITRLARPSK